MHRHAYIFWYALLLPVLILGCGEKGAPRPAEPTLAERHGERLFAGACAVCHKADSTDPLNGPGLKGMYKKSFLPSGAPANDERVREVIRRGRRNMPGFAESLTDSQISDLIAYLHTL